MNDNRKCYGCGELHHGLERGSRQAYCSAWGKTCSNCGLINHISRACLKKEIIQEPTVQQGSQATTTTTASDTANNTTSLEQAELRGTKNNSMIMRQEHIAFAGAVMSQEKVDKVPNDKILTPKPRSNIEYWQKEHEAHKKDLKKKEVRTIIIGDSIIKHVNKSSISKKAEWKSARIANFGIGGDRVENILYRIQSYPIVKEIRKVVIAVGTQPVHKLSKDD